MIITVRMPIAAQLGEALADAALDDVFEVNDAEQACRPWRPQAACRRLGDRIRMALISRTASAGGRIAAVAAAGRGTAWRVR